MRRRTFVNHTVAWLALMAVAMLFIAPVISKLIAHRTVCQYITHTTPMTLSEMHHGMDATAYCESPAPGSHMMMSGQAISPMEEITCGYCLLLVDLPFAQFVLTFLLWLLLLYVIDLFLFPLHSTAISRCWLPQHARAPPCWVSVQVLTL